MDDFKEIEAKSSEKFWPPIALGLLFGSERFGMSNADVYRCHACLQIPTDPQFGSLNLASAIQLIAYEWRIAMGGFLHKSTEKSASNAIENTASAIALADMQSIAAALAHWQEALVAIDYLDPASPKKLLPRLQQMLNRTELRNEEIHILRGVAKKVLRTAALSKR
mgnify:CR=1 FL=1